MEVKIVNRVVVLPFIACFLVLFSSVDSLAWWSLGGSTHARIAEDAMGLLSRSEYPDILKYKEQVSNGSSEESHNSSKNDIDNNNSLDGGYPIAFWNKANDVYKCNDYSNAYYNIGRICHLIQDMGTPPHAANIFHGWCITSPFKFDNLEEATSLHYNHVSVSPFYGEWGGGRSGLDPV
jgi:hypothetical protein